MGAGAVLRFKKLKGKGIIRAAAAHNLRAIQAERGAGGHIDSGRTAQNLHLAGPADPAAVSRLADDRMRAAGIGHLREDAVRAIEFVVSLPVNAGIDDHAFFSSAMHWLAKRFGGEDNILSADIHRDEAAPHMQLLLLPLIGGRMVGSDALGGRSKLRTLQAEFFDQVCQPHGLKRYPQRLSGARKTSVTTAVLAEIKRLGDASLKLLWPLLRDCIEADPVPFAEHLGLAVDAPVKPKKLRSSTDIFISTGKGPKREPETPTPIRKARAAEVSAPALRLQNPIGFAHQSTTARNGEPYAL